MPSSILSSSPAPRRRHSSATRRSTAESPVAAQTRAPRLRGALCALTLALGAALPAQSLGLEVTPYDKQSGVPQQAADEFGISMVATPQKQMIVQLWGGKPGALAGIVFGVSKIKLPIFGATLLATPDLLLYSIFDGNGEAEFRFPLIQALDLNVQGIQMDLVKPASLFTLTWGLDFRVVQKQSSTAFDAKLAEVLMELSYDAYEEPKRSGPLRPGMRLAGGFQVLSKIVSQNPPNNLWFKKLLWPHTQLFIARNASADLAVVFRGTDLNDIRNIITNLGFPIVDGFHGGIRLAYLSVVPELDKSIRRNVNKNARVMITGHSLGGGLASIATTALTPTLQVLGVARDNIVHYSFASSRVMTPKRAAELGARVPHHYAVANKDDLLTHTSALGLEHIPQMRVLYPRRAMIVEKGKDYIFDLLGRLAPGVAAHYQHEYLARLSEILPDPKVWMTVSAGGNMTINWSFPEREKHGFLRDMVGLYRGDPRTKGTRAFLLGGWQWASASGSYETSWPKGENFHVAYIQEYFLAGERKFLATSDVFKSRVPVLSLTRPNGLITLNWSGIAPGKFDWVAVYQGVPGNPQNYLCGGKSWNWAVNRSSHVTNWREARDLYIGYVAQETLLGPGKIVKYEGPFHFVPAPTVRLTWKDNWPFFHLQVHFANARVNTFDWVAIYDRDPSIRGAIRLYKAHVTGTSWKQTLVAHRKGYYAAHYEQGCLLSSPRLVAKWGPLQ